MKQLKVFLFILAVMSFPAESFAGGPWKVDFQDIKLPTQAMLEHQTFTRPGASNPAYMISANSLSNGVAASLSTFLAQPDFARNIVLRFGSSTGAVGSGTAVVTGLNIFGQTITENFTIASGQSGDVAGNKAFKSISLVTIPAPNAPGATISVGFGNKLGTKRCADRAGDYVFSEFGGVYSLTRGVFAVNSTLIESNTFLPNSTLNGDSNVEFFFIQNYRCY